MGKREKLTQTNNNNGEMYLQIKNWPTTGYTLTPQTTQVRWAARWACRKTQIII